MRVSRAGALTCIACAMALLSPAALGSSAEDDVHFLEYRVDDFKIALMSGNFTAYILYDWPTVVFEHARDYFSSTFQVSLPVLYLFNDTDGNGMFTRSEATYRGYLDTLHMVTWNMSDVIFVEPVGGPEQAMVGMWAYFDLFDAPQAEQAAVEDWGRLSIWFSISESPVTYSNSLGNYVVDGRLDLRLNLTVEVLKPLNCTGVAIEQDLRGGWGSDVFLLTEEDELGEVNATEVLGSVDETGLGDDFAHRFMKTHLPTQRVDFVKEDWTAQAHYKFSSVPMVTRGGEPVEAEMNSSYYTTGTDLVLHTAYFLPNDTTMLTHDLCLGIDEAGFYTGVRHWFSENLASILIVTGTVATIISVAVLLTMYRRMKRNGGSCSSMPEDQPKGPLQF